MNIIKWLFGILVLVVLAVVVLVWSLPNEYNVSRSVVINAPAAKIYPMIAITKEWKNWSVWNQRDPAMLMTYSGPASGVGAEWRWESKSQGNGSMKFLDVVQDQKIVYELSFEGMGKPSSGKLLLTPEGNGTKVTWTMHGNADGNLKMRLFGAVMDKMVGPDFEAGLANLKRNAEHK
ncbi:Polyketide cyclase / dehydrase and lipid transport [Solimicrobium silvestre]|uniref:Polyketide cyclase / dehydrase and lipid transport n=2 Tax=Solimicrobium silvestre TaxID=2099400 RepID=A0A2S9GYW0_9BURK|nr:Polyketide cyclase / dehydrase and lipid transport [Solimicrobium silvestre]